MNVDEGFKHCSQCQEDICKNCYRLKVNELTFAHFEKEEIEEAAVSSDAVTVVLMKSGTKVTDAHCSGLIY